MVEPQNGWSHKVEGVRVADPLSTMSPMAWNTHTRLLNVEEIKFCYSEPLKFCGLFITSASITLMNT